MEPLQVTETTGMLMLEVDFYNTKKRTKKKEDTSKQDGQLGLMLTLLPS